MSRFFRQADDSDSDSDSSEEEELMSGSEDEKPSKPTAGGKPMGMARFLKGAAGSSSESSGVVVGGDILETLRAGADRALCYIPKASEASTGDAWGR